MPDTLPDDVADASAARRARAARQIILTLVAVLVLIGATGFLGVRTGTVSAEGDGYTLTATYGSVTRPGLATPFSVEVTRAGGFENGFELAVASSFLEAFDENGLDPEPVSSRGDGTWTTWGFDRPDGDRFELSFDARLEPAVQWKRPGAVQLLVAGRVVTEVAFTMWVMP